MTDFVATFKYISDKNRTDISTSISGPPHYVYETHTDDSSNHVGAGSKSTAISAQFIIMTPSRKNIYARIRERPNVFLKNLQQIQPSHYPERWHFLNRWTGRVKYGDYPDAKSSIIANVYDKVTSNDFFIKIVDAAIRHLLRRYWTQNSHVNPIKIAFQAEPVLLILKNAGGSLRSHQHRFNFVKSFNRKLKINSIVRLT